MELSADTEAVLAILDEAVEGGLRKRNDIGTLLELAASKADHAAFNELTLKGTGLWKVYNVLRRQTPGSDGYRTLEQEFGSLLNDVRTLMADLSTDADDALLKRFDDIYFGMTHGVVRNLVDLAHDLSHIKALQRGS
jgi:hypothetical protein